MSTLATPRPGSILARLGPTPKIAVLRPGRLGDMVVATPALRALRATVPRAHISLLTSQEVLPFARRLRSVDELIVVPPVLDISKGNADETMAALFANLRARHFDLALQCLGGGETMNAFVKEMGARFTAGGRSPDAPELDLWMPFHRLQPEVLRLMDIMGLIGAPTGSLCMEVDVRPEDLADLRQLPNLDCDALASGHFLGAHVGSGSGARRWPPERFAAVLDALLDEADFRVALIAGQQETDLTKSVVRHMRHQERTLDLAGQLSLGGLIGLLSQLRLLISNDSGPAHLATALNVPAVIIFGSAHPATWAPLFRLWQRPVADEDAPCRRFSPPCGCPDDSRAHCLNAVTVDAVLWEAHAILRLIAEAQSSSSPTMPTLAKKSTEQV